MTLPSSPPITMAELAAEYGGPKHLTAYYSGGTYVTANTQNGSGFLIPASGTITLCDFLGVTNSQPSHFYTTPGAGTETVPAGAVFVTIEVWGGGGGGAGAGSMGADGAGGGGAGGYSLSVRHSCAAAQTITYHVGAAGSDVLTGSPGNGGKGGESNVSGIGLTMRAGGGAGGNAAAATGGQVTGGLGGTANGGTTLNQTGNTGIAGNFTTGFLGGGATANQGMLGNSLYGAGGVVTFNLPAVTGELPGGAGGAGGNSSVGFTGSSGPGGPGGVRFIYYTS